MILFSRTIQIVFSVIFLFLVMGGAHSYDEHLSIATVHTKKYISLNDVIQKCNLESSFDLISQKGKIYYKSHYGVYTVSHALFVIDGRLFRSNDEVIRHHGSVMVPVDAAIALIESFFNDRQCREQGNAVVLVKKRIDDAGEERPVVKKEDEHRKDKITFIVIDPGHGGKDPGAVSKGGKKEKHITLSVALLLEKELKKNFKNLKIIMTRRNDSFIELAKRTDVANKFLKKNQNGIFLSIHVNATLSSIISGFETYYLSQNPSNEEARNTAALENNVIVLEDRSHRNKAYNDIDYIEAMMITTQIQKESKVLANSIQQGMNRKIRKFKSRGVKKADFFVLRGALMPAVLVEVGFITNTKEAQYLTTKTYQQSIARGLARGVSDFVNKYNSMIK